MAKSVPPIDVVPESQSPDRFEELQFRSLEAEAKAKEHLNSEADQRYWLRWLAVATCVIIIFGMGLMLSHVVHKLMTLKTFGAPSAYIIAVYVAPVVSMTSLSIALLVAAFRGFKEGDGDAGAKAIGDGVKAGKIFQ
jgi:uncharacterized membrane protein